MLCLAIKSPKIQVRLNLVQMRAYGQVVAGGQLRALPLAARGRYQEPFRPDKDVFWPVAPCFVDFPSLSAYMNGRIRGAAARLRLGESRKVRKTEDSC